MSYSIVHYSVDFQSKPIAIIIDSGEKQEMMTESQLLSAISTARKERAKYKDVREWQNALNVYEMALKQLRLQVEINRWR
jgi:hypothetical protein